jgi:hypothetical protein
MWYTAKLLFRSSLNPDDGTEPTWEESIRLVNANSESEARDLAEQMGQAARVTYDTESGSLTWLFERVERVYCVGASNLDHGAEVFSRFLRHSEVASLLTPFAGS